MRAQILFVLAICMQSAMAAEWKALASDQVQAAVRNEAGGAVCLDYDFGKVSGYAVARREMPLNWPDNTVLNLRLKAQGGPNTVQLKWVDASGDNVWWLNQPDAAIGAQWQALRIPMRRIQFAWGPTTDQHLRDTRFMEIVVVAGKAGGKGSLCADGMRWTTEAPPPAVMPEPRWDGARGAWDAGVVRDFSGALLTWPANRKPRNYRLQTSVDGRHWQTLRSVNGAQAGVDALYLPEARARWLRLAGHPAPQSAQLKLTDAAGDKAWRNADDALKARAALEPRGNWPRAYLGEQSYWTLLGEDGMGPHSALVSEDGAVELGVAGPSLEPVIELLRKDGRTERITWAQVQSTPSLAQGDLPLPHVRWQHPDFALDISTSASDAAALLRYRLTAVSADIQSARLLLMLRPLQVNPPQQFLNTPGGHARVSTLRMGPQGLEVDSRWRLSTWPAAHTVQAATGDSDALSDAARSLWSKGRVQGQGLLTDPLGQAGAVLTFDLPLNASAPQVNVRFGLRGQTAPLNSSAQADALQAQATTQWQERLNRLTLDLPAADPRLARTLRVSLAHMLLSRDGPALRPGTRAYARTWIRDGAMMVSGLARMGESVVAREFVDWFAQHLFANGKVPCCIDARGSDPVVENDSHGQYIFAVAELWRLRQPGDGIDAAWLARHWPRVQAAIRYMESLRQSERIASRLGSRAAEAAFYGMMPASISHEGYSAKPMHSYWDNFWALRGYKDAVLIAQTMHAEAEAQSFVRWRDEFQTDLTASLTRAMAFHKVAHLPGAAELGDFDATSSTVALDPAHAEDLLPSGSLNATFERYWTEAQSRVNGTRNWKDYTPYELRTVGSLLRMGHQQRAWKMLDFFFADQRPAGWLQWAEVVMRDPREVHFLGDMPHAWVSSDYVRSALDTLVYEREQSGRSVLVIGAGWTPAWWQRGRLHIEGLVTSQGRVALQLTSSAQAWTLRVDGLNAGAQSRLVWPEGLPLPQASAAGARLVWDGRELLLPGADGKGSLLVQLQATSSSPTTASTDAP